MDRFVDLNDCNVIRSKSGYHKDCGTPLGQFICRKEYTQEAIKICEIHDPIVEVYHEHLRRLKEDM